MESEFAACPSLYDRDTVEEESDEEDPPSTPPATILMAFAYKTMFESLEEAQDNGR